MNAFGRIATSTLALAAAGIFLLAAPAGAEEPACYECHDELPAVSVAHDPVDSGECEACHEDHGDDEELRLVEEGSALCFQCHDEYEGKGSMHPPVEDGECTECHNPHGSNNRSLLVATGGELCFSCHDEYEGKGSMHPPVEDGECTECHSPHDSNNGSLLVATGGELCFNCHDDGGFNDPVSHDAVDEGCTECHSPHASDHTRLLTANLTFERLEMFEESQGELCFSCHDVEAFTADKTEDTDFRHGTQNLHAHHLKGGAKKNKYGMIKKKAGQTCIACHLPHSSLQDRLVRTEFECKGIFCYTMRFRPNDKGGTCVVGCHKPKTYSRDAVEQSSMATVGNPSANMQVSRTP